MRRFGEWPHVNRNFYAEFLAAVDVMATAEQRCPQAWVEPYAVDQRKLEDYVAFADLASLTGLGTERLAELNPALGSLVLAGRYRVPRGYALNLPAGTRKEATDAYLTEPRGRWNGKGVV